MQSKPASLHATCKENVDHGADGEAVTAIHADLGPRLARLVVVQADAVGRAEEHVNAVREALALESRVGNDRKVLRLLELDHGGAIGEDDAQELLFACPCVISS